MNGDAARLAQFREASSNSAVWSSLQPSGSPTIREGADESDEDS